MTLSVHVPGSYLIFYFQVPCFILYYVHMYYQDHHENQQQ